MTAGWRHRALCATVDPELWFPPPGARATAAKRICAGCPVRAECLAFALAVAPQYGIWAGLNTTELDALRAEHSPPVPCSRCGRPFVRTHSNSAYCGTACRRAARRAQQAASQHRLSRIRRAAA
jgi:hypothetical protein